ncbi:MAG: PH domain-containing protein [Deltaproteobacteria bacterium]|nr:PH domain-containing protein [Deltaproteobacteria bacterium]MBW2050766.1 PH domain-containing protein [Deltaproteobacteria bacterium]MBW2141368.1 PH domain-containing protein [Deltaproteobacteria bacterium]MBW2321974.1 PH domain-containing protein [Deltaproteobacteria bacterium]
MNDRLNNDTSGSEEVLLRARPVWRSFFVFFLGIAICVGGPLLKEDSPLNPAIGFVLAAIFLLLIIRRWSNVYTLTNRRLSIKGEPFFRHTSEIYLEDIDGIDVNQGLTLRIMGVGHLLISSRKSDQANMLLYGMPDPMNFKKRLEKLVTENRDKTSF